MISKPGDFLVKSFERESMLRYETISFIEHVEVDKLSIYLLCLILVVDCDLSYTSPSFVSLVHNFVAHQVIPRVVLAVLLEYCQRELIWSVVSNLEALGYFE